MVLKAVKILTLIFARSKSDMRVRCRLSTQQHGFTLLELLLVLSILAMAASLLVPVLSTLEGPSFNAQVREANNLLNFARRQAVVTGQVAGIEFLLNEASEAAGAAETSDDNANPADDDNNPTMRNTVLRQWQGHDIALWYEDDSNPMREIEETLLIEFFPEGGSTGGELLFRQDGRESRIVIDPFSGRVSVP
jgi:general secretion pathway protein H